MVLTGIQRGWVWVMKSAHHEMLSALNNRTEGNKAILVADDCEALRYQIAYYRFRRASESLIGPAIISSRSSVDGYKEHGPERNRMHLDVCRQKAIVAKTKLHEMMYHDEVCDYG